VLFNSLDFLLFFLVVFGLNQGLRPWPRAQKWMLLAASYWFYGQWNWTYLALIIGSTLLDYSIGLGLVKVRPMRRRTLMTVSLVANLGLLAFFKYANWLILNWNATSGWLGLDWQFGAVDVLLPVGISFYTFQSLSYTIDVYRGDSPPRRSLLDYALFVAFFPQLVAGPIVRDGEFFKELDSDRRLDAERFQRGIVLIVFGLVKKMVFADGLATVVDPVFDNPASQGFWDVLLATYAFAFQIYCDFSGYTDIAIGVALLLGFRFPQNFNYPYVASSFQDFWRRWHMTLSRWLRDYLYISLGGNRRGKVRTYINLMLTMLLGGLWHGASWNFVIWGGLHGGYLAFERAVLMRFRLWRSDARTATVLRWIIVFHMVCLAWIFFRAATLDASLQLIGHLGDPLSQGFSADRHLWLVLLLSALMFAHLLGGLSGTKTRLMKSGTPAFALSMAALILVLIWFTPEHSAPFIYFQF